MSPFLVWTMQHSQSARARVTMVTRAAAYIQSEPSDISIARHHRRGPSSTPSASPSSPRAPSS
eukprot:4919997-Pyramimonas_sp.AAC.1